MYPTEPLPVIHKVGLLDHLPVMIDIETGGIRPDAPIASIGAVRFKPDGTRLEGPENEFYMAINLVGPNQPAPDASTMYWWMRQSEEARAAFCEGEHGARLSDALYALRHWLSGAVRPDFVDPDLKVVFQGEVWIRGDRDSVWLDEAYRRCGWPLPYKYSKVRDQRSIVEFARSRGVDIPFQEETAHNALLDARYQVDCLAAVFKHWPSMESYWPEPEA